MKKKCKTLPNIVGRKHKIKQGSFQKLQIKIGLL